MSKVKTLIAIAKAKDAFGLTLEEHRDLFDDQVTVDRVEYYINQIDKILGILIAPLQARLVASAGLG